MIALDTWPHYISHYGYLAVFLFSLVEGPIITIFAAFLASQGVLDAGMVYAVVVAGDLVGDLVYYAIGRWLIGRLPWRFGVRGQELRRRIDGLRGHIRTHAGRILLFGKLTQSAGFAVLLAAGAARVPIDTFTAYNVIGTLPKSAVLLAIGYFGGDFYKTLDSELQLIGLIGFIVICIVMIALLHRMRTPHGPEGIR